MVARFQSVISKEIKKQLKAKEGRDYPDYLIACVGGGSNASGTFYEYLEDDRVKLIAAEAAGKGLDSGCSAATIHLGKEGIIHGSRTLVMQTDDGQIEEAYSVSAGLDYPGIGPLQTFLARSKRSEVFAVTDRQALDAAMELTRMEGIIPALESAHAVAVLNLKKFAPLDIVVITVSGRGDKDMETYLKNCDYKNKNHKRS
jgi:tryptophan synthase beta chain